jgi:hypothetical protein
MSTCLINGVGNEYLHAETPEKLFSRVELDDLKKQQQQQSGSIPSADPFEACSNNLYMGFFFDGTKNNYTKAEANKAHSNVARLYDAFPGRSVPGTLSSETDWTASSESYSHFFKIYVPGVASPFDQIEDSGDGQKSAAMGYRCADRITWGLIQAINSVHRYFYDGTQLFAAAEAYEFCKKVSLSRNLIWDLTNGRPSQQSDVDENRQRSCDVIEEQLELLHKAVKQHWPERDMKCSAKITPAIVKKIHVSVFGFSRGATEARAFVNFLIAMCKCDARLSKRGAALTLGGFEVVIDFIGIFDTVASIGIANTFGNSLLLRGFDGHGAWADAEHTLRIPSGVPCVHIIAAHEIRRSFPVDSISVKGAFDDSFTEVVMPGMHSDIGCGYEPREQGRGITEDGSDMLSRIPLIYMYREASLAGVPFRLDEATDRAKNKFKITAQTISDFQAYVAQCKYKEGPITDIMREQRQLYIQWRLARRENGSAPLSKTASFSRASQFDQNDLKSANIELESEIKEFESWLDKKGGKFKPKPQMPGFDDAHANEWEEIATWWDTSVSPPPAVSKLFDDYVHDSRAWFKMIPGNPDSEQDMFALLETWKKQLEKEKTQQSSKPSHDPAEDHQSKPKQPPSQLTREQSEAALAYSRTGKIPEMFTTGREPFDRVAMFGFQGARAGYLRYRKVYSGGDSILISDAGVRGYAVAA